MRPRLSLLVLFLVAAVSACGGGSSTVVTVQFVGNSSCPADNTTAYSPSPPNTNTAPVGQAIDEMPHTHVAPPTKIQYNHNPPTSGCHYSLGAGTAPISAGVHPPTPAIAAEYWLHNLEHGYIGVTYNCPSGCNADLQTLNKWFAGLPPDPGGGVPYAKFIAVSYPQQKEKFDLVAWDWFDPLGSTLNMAEIQRFFANHVNQAPEGATAP